MMHDMGRKALLNRLVEQGSNAFLRGEKCSGVPGRELERAAWEIGWRAARDEARKNKVKQEVLCTN